ncbi:DUF6083 domain-containing protein [Kitasatospora sp. NPDC088134]|uniref:DUF6083 domain-containing protein n=1 Tax=Kitasatospora sp. NPDC088134 TaxID=3364071 RepID=UPI0037F2E83A
MTQTPYTIPIGARLTPAARLDPWSPSKTLRSHATGACQYCGNPVEWYDRADGGRIPMLPGEFPARRIPGRYRWTVEGGSARHGSHGRIDKFCRIAHPAVCPGVQHTGLDPVLVPLQQALALRTRRMIDAGTFTAPLADDTAEDAAEEPEPAPAPDAPAPAGRHVLAWGGRLRIAPCPIDEVRCIALDDESGDRCEDTLFDLAEGSWEQIPVPVPPGRKNTRPRGAMWVWELAPLHYRDALRWMQQRCTLHHDSDAPDAVPCEFVEFNADRHGNFVLRHRPPGYQRPAPAPEPGAEPGEPVRTVCSGDNCTNTTVVPDVPPDWLCYACARTRQRRSETHRRWQHQPDDAPPRLRPWQKQEGQQP